MKDLGKTTIGIQPHLAAALAYLLGWVTGIIIFLVEKENKFVRFHAMQSIVVFGALSVVAIVLTLVPVIGWTLLPLLSLVQLVLAILLIIKALQGEGFKLPVAGDIAEKHI